MKDSRTDKEYSVAEYRLMLEKRQNEPLDQDEAGREIKNISKRLEQYFTRIANLAGQATAMRNTFIRDSLKNLSNEPDINNNLSHYKDELKKPLTNIIINNDIAGNNTYPEIIVLQAEELARLLKIDIVKDPSHYISMGVGGKSLT